MMLPTTNRLIPKTSKILLFILTLGLFLVQGSLFSQCDGGLVLSASTATSEASICLEDAASTGLNVYNTSFAPTKYAYAITDINNNILYVSTSNNLRFENLIEGSYYIYGFSYLGDIIANQGDYVYSSKFSTGCWQISFNRIAVKLASPRPSEIRTGDFQTSKNLCLNQGAPDFVSLQNLLDQNTDYVYLVTDMDDKIIRVSDKSIIDFSNFPTGTCRIYGLAYTGRLLANFGMFITEPLSTGCYVLSNNSIEVRRSLVSGGDVFTQDFTPFYFITTDDGAANNLVLSSSGSALASYAFVLTDVFNNVIEVLDQSSIDFEGFDSGTYRIWGFSYSGNISLSPGQSIFSAAFSDACYARSNNAITITAIHEGIGPPPCTVSVSDIMATSETALCSNGAIESVLTNANLNQSLPSALILSNAANEIVQINQSQEIETFSLLPGNYAANQIVYEQISGLLVGQILDDLSGCFALSNTISIEILSEDDERCQTEVVCEQEAGILSVDIETVCIEDLENRSVTFEIENIGDAENGIIITDLNGSILRLSANHIFEIDEVGTQRYYHINYESDVEIFGGESIVELEGCFALSNPIDITGIDDCLIVECEILPASLVVADPTDLCATDPTDDLVSISSNGGTGESQVFIVTTQGSSTIISSQATGDFMFTEDEIGAFNIYQLDFNDPFELGADISELEGCFALSAPIQITNTDENCIIEPPMECLNNGGTIALTGPSGICGSDGQNDIIGIEVLETGGPNRAFIMVDEFNRIVSVAPAIVILNNPFPEGIYDICALSYEDFPSGLSINANLNDFEDLCLSNKIQISVSNDFCVGSGVRGGLVSNGLGENQIKFCTNVPDETFELNLETTGSTAFDYRYVETDENDFITRIIDGNTISYTADATQSMSSKVYGVSYTGNFSAAIGDNIFSIALSDDEFDISENFISIEVSVVIGEDPMIVGAEGPFLEIASGQEALVDFIPNMSSFLDYETAYILFDIDGVTIIDILYPDENMNITLPPLAATPLTGELLSLTAVAYTGNILLLPGGQANSSFLPNATDVTDGCFDVGATNIAIRVFDLGGFGGQEETLQLRSTIQEEIILKPNPVRETMEVVFPASFKGESLVINIYSFAGELILKRTLHKAPATELIDFTTYTNGTYTLQVYTSSNTRTVQFLKI